MARTTLNFSSGIFDELIEKLDGLGGDIKNVVEDALNQAGETIEWDTLDAVNKSNMPAGGIYSTGDTEKSIVRNPQTKWSGQIAEISVGFDYEKPGAGGYLITGTPRMKPNRALNTMYKGKKYIKQIENDMKDVINDAIIEKMEG